MICRDKDQLIISKDILGYDASYEGDVFKINYRSAMVLFEI